MHKFERCWNYLGVIKEKYSWLLNEIPTSPNNILNVGCADGREAVSLLWLFEPDEMIVIDKEVESEKMLTSQITEIKTDAPACWDDKWKIEFKVWDITKKYPGLESDIFDFIYCDNVLYNIIDEMGEKELQRAIDELSRLTITGGYAVFVEPKVGKTPLERKTEKVNIPEEDEWLLNFVDGMIILEGDVIDLRPFMQEAGLEIVNFDVKNIRYIGRKKD